MARIDSLIAGKVARVVSIGAGVGGERAHDLHGRHIGTRRATGGRANVGGVVRPLELRAAFSAAKVKGHRRRFGRLQSEHRIVFSTDTEAQIAQTHATFSIR